MKAAARGAWALSFALACAFGAQAQAPREVHGSHDAYAAPGVALAWGVLRGTTDAATQVVIRVAADPATYPLVAARGRDPFSAQSEPLLAATPTQLAVEIRVPRARFSDLPRTEILLYAKPDAAPVVIVYYLGVPDTTPELSDEAALHASLEDRIVRAIAAAARKP